MKVSNRYKTPKEMMDHFLEYMQADCSAHNSSGSKAYIDAQMSPEYFSMVLRVPEGDQTYATDRPWVIKAVAVKGAWIVSEYNPSFADAHDPELAVEFTKYVFEDKDTE